MRGHEVFPFNLALSEAFESYWKNCRDFPRSTPSRRDLSFLSPRVVAGLATMVSPSLHSDPFPAPLLTGGGWITPPPMETSQRRRVFPPAAGRSSEGTSVEIPLSLLRENVTSWRTPFLQDLSPEPLLGR